MIQNGHLYQEILTKISERQKQLFLLVDPDKFSASHFDTLTKTQGFHRANMILVGSSFLHHSLDKCIAQIKSITNKPILLFPGHSSHLSKEADGLLALSLISGRNPDFLIGHHVTAAFKIAASKLEVIPTAYILIDGGTYSSVEYMSNTRPIPSDKTDIAVATALAGEISGNKLIYLEAGSGAKQPVNKHIIRSVRNKCSVPLIVGGGIRNKQDAQAIWDAGADIIVIGNALEKKTELLEDLFD